MSELKPDNCDFGTAVNLRFYENHWARFAAKASTYQMEPLYAPFLENISAGGFILDAGCGSGRDSVAFLKRGYRVKAVDISPTLVSLTRQAGVEAEVKALQELDYGPVFDGIWACASLLHIPKRDIVGVLGRLAIALHPGGVLFATLKEGEGEELAEDGRFFVYYKLEEFRTLLETAGWDVLLTKEDVIQGRRPWLQYLAKWRDPDAI